MSINATEFWAQRDIATAMILDEYSEQIESEIVQKICQYAKQRVCIILDPCVKNMFTGNCMFFNLSKDWYQVTTTCHSGVLI